MRVPRAWCQSSSALTRRGRGARAVLERYVDANLVAIAEAINDGCNGICNAYRSDMDYLAYSCAWLQNFYRGRSDLIKSARAPFYFAAVS